MMILIGVALSLVLLPGIGLFMIFLHLLESVHASPVSPTATDLGSAATATSSKRCVTEIAESMHFLADKRGVAPGQLADDETAVESWPPPKL